MPNVQFPGAIGITSLTWTNFKAIVSPKVISMQYDDDGIVYTIFAVDGDFIYTCSIWKGILPDGVIAGGYSQGTNDSDKSDFETNYKPYANMPILDTDLDPRLIHRFGNLTTTSASEVLMANQTYAEPASQAQRSVVSTSVQDKAAGSGSVAVRITYLDSNYTLATEDVTLNGTVAVNTASSTIRFIEKFQVIQGAAAVGKISIMSTTGGGGSQVAAIGSGTEDAFMCHHYVPAGKRAYILGWGAAISNNANFKLKGQQRFGANLVDQNLDLMNLTISSPNLPEFYRLYESPLYIGEKCYIRVTVVPGQGTSTIERAQLDIWEDKF